MEATTSPDELAERGKQAYDQGAFHEAARYFEEAALAYQALNDRLNAAEMRNNASVAWLRADLPEKALASAQGSDTVFAEAGDLRRQGMALGNQAAALEALERFAEALNLYRRAADALKAAGENEFYGIVMQRIAALQVQQGKRLEALFSMEAALENKPRLSPKEQTLKSLIGTVRRMMGLK